MFNDFSEINFKAKIAMEFLFFWIGEIIIPKNNFIFIGRYQMSQAEDFFFFEV